MRDRTNIYLGDGTEGLVRIMKNFYREGAVEVVFDEGREVSKIVKELQKHYVVLLKRYDEYEDSPYFSLAVGKKAFFAVRRRGKGKFGSYVTSLNMDLFAERERYAEFLYFDNARYDVEDRDRVTEGYALVLSAMAEGLAIYYMDKGEPYVDKELRGYLSRGRTLLMGEGNKEDYFRDCLSLAKGLGEKTGYIDYVSVKMAESLGGEVTDYIESACFLNRSLILFTKWNFRDILITVEQPVDGVSTDILPPYGEEELILKDNDMERVYRYLDRYRKKIGLATLIDNFRQSLTANTPFAEIYNRGIYEGIIEKW